MSKGTFAINPLDVATVEAGGNKQVVVSFSSQPDFTEGRRSWVKYRELGVTDASRGAMRAQVIHAGTANEPTGWHYHRCEMQFLYVVSGSISIAFSPQQVIRLASGDSIMIPGGTLHLELGEPEGVEVVEVSIPAEMGTETVDNPWGDAEVDFSSAASSAKLAQLVG